MVSGRRPQGAGSEWRTQWRRPGGRCHSLLRLGCCFRRSQRCGILGDLWPFRANRFCPNCLCANRFCANRFCANWMTQSLLKVLFDAPLRLVVMRRLVRLVVRDGNRAVTLAVRPRRGIRIAVAKLALNRDRDILVDRAGVGLLFLDAKFWQQLEDTIRLDL